MQVGPVSVIRVAVLLAFLACLATSQPARAQSADQPVSAMEGVGVDEQLDARVPLGLAFTDEQDREVRLADYFDGTHPVILTLNYYKCPMLCTLQLNGMVDTLSMMEWTAGQQFEIVTVSFNPLETPLLARQKKQNYIQSYGRPSAGAGWHFLTGGQAEIDALTQSVGFNYRWDDASQQYVHVAALIMLTPDGRVSRYLYDVLFEPRDLKLALLEASEGRIGTTVDHVLMYCYTYDPASGSYVPAAMNLMRLGGLLTLVVLAIVLGSLWARELARRRRPATGAGEAG